MPQQQTAIPADLLELRQRLEQWRSEQPRRSRLPESIWTAAVEMAQRHGLYRTTKALRLDYTGLEKTYAGGIAIWRTAAAALSGTIGADCGSSGRVRGGVGIGARAHS